MILPEEKLQLIRIILETEDEDLIEHLKASLRDFRKTQSPRHIYANKAGVSFEKWMTQYAQDTRDPDEYLPEYEMTLKEFQYHLYRQELQSNNVD